MQKSLTFALAFFYRELKLNFRQNSDYILALSFWLILICFFPLASNASPLLLQSFAPGILWIGLLLTQLLSLTKFFKEDYESGLLNEYYQSPYAFLFIIFLKLGSLWIILYLPILLIAPLLGLLLQLPTNALLIFEITILLGSPSLMLLSALVSSISLTLKNSALLVNLLFLPLTIPLLIFATSAISLSFHKLSPIAPLLWLGVILLSSFIIFPPAILAILKAHFD